MYLTAVELTSTYYPKAAVMETTDINTYLMRANSFAQGIVGGPLPEAYIDDGLKTAVAMAFEIMAQGESAKVDAVTGNITEAAPAGYYQVKRPDPLDTVKTMLIPYTMQYDRLLKPDNNRGVRFL